MSILTAERLETAKERLHGFVTGSYGPYSQIPSDIEIVLRHIAALTPPTDGSGLSTIIGDLRMLSECNDPHQMMTLTLAADAITSLSAECERLQQAALDAVKKKDELHLRLEPLQRQLLAESEARAAAEATLATTEALKPTLFGNPGDKNYKALLSAAGRENDALLRAEAAERERDAAVKALAEIAVNTPDGIHPLDGHLAPAFTRLGKIARAALTTIKEPKP